MLFHNRNDSFIYGVLLYARHLTVTGGGAPPLGAQVACATFSIAFTEIYCTCLIVFCLTEGELYEDSDGVISYVYTPQGLDRVRSPQTCGK